MQQSTIMVVGGYQPLHPYDGGAMGFRVRDDGTPVISVEPKTLEADFLYFGDDLDKQWRVLYSYTDPRASTDGGSCHVWVPTGKIELLDATEFSRVLPVLSVVLKKFKQHAIQPFHDGTDAAAAIAIANDPSLWERNMEVRLAAVRYLARRAKLPGAVIQQPWYGLPHAIEDESRRQAIYLSREAMWKLFEVIPKYSCTAVRKAIVERNLKHPRFVHALSPSGTAFPDAFLTRPADTSRSVVKSGDMPLPISAVPTDALLYGRVGWPQGTEGILLTSQSHASWSGDWAVEPEPFLTTHRFTVVDGRQFASSPNDPVQSMVTALFTGAKASSGDLAALKTVIAAMDDVKAHAFAVRYLYAEKGNQLKRAIDGLFVPDGRQLIDTSLARISVAPGQHVEAVQHPIDQALLRLRRFVAEHEAKTAAEKLEAVVARMTEVPTTWSAITKPAFLANARADARMLVYARIERIDTFIARTSDDIKPDDTVTRAAADALIAVLSDPEKVSRIVDSVYHGLGGDQKMQNYTNGQPAELNTFNEGIALAVDAAILAESEPWSNAAVTAQREGILRAARVFRDVPDPAYPVHPFGADEPAFEPKFYGPGKPLSDGINDEAIVRFYEEAPTSRINTGRRIFGDLWDGTSRNPGLAFMLAPPTEDGVPSSRAFFDRPLIAVVRTGQARVDVDIALKSLQEILRGPVLAEPVDMTKAAFLRMLLVYSGLLDPMDRATSVNLEAPPTNNFDNAVLRVGYDLLLKARPVAKFGGMSLGDLAYSAYREDDDRKVPAINGEDPTLESLLNDAEGKAQANHRRLGADLEIDEIGAGEREARLAVPPDIPSVAVRLVDAVPFAGALADDAHGYFAVFLGDPGIDDVLEGQLVTQSDGIFDLVVDHGHLAVVFLEVLDGLFQADFGLRAVPRPSLAGLLFVLDVVRHRDGLVVERSQHVLGEPGAQLGVGAIDLLVALVDRGALLARLVGLLVLDLLVALAEELDDGLFRGVGKGRDLGHVVGVRDLDEVPVGVLGHGPVVLALLIRFDVDAGLHVDAAEAGRVEVQRCAMRSRVAGRRALSGRRAGRSGRLLNGNGSRTCGHRIVERCACHRRAASPPSMVAEHDWWWGGEMRNAACVDPHRLRHCSPTSNFYCPH
jgi:hypothetical protein